MLLLLYSLTFLFSVDLDIEEADLRLWMAGVHYGAGLGTSIDDEADSGPRSKDGVRPQHVLRRQGFHSGNLHHRDVVLEQRRRRIDGECADKLVDVFDWCVGWEVSK